MNSWKFLLCLSMLLLLACEQNEWQKVSFNSTDGLKVTADLYDANAPEAPIILMFHQSASSRGEYRRIAPILREKGFNCLAVDLRWGKQDFWDKVPNETGARSGSVEVIDNYEDTPEYREKEVWPRMWASLPDMEAAISWVRKEGYSGKLITWGSSFSAMLQFKLATTHSDMIDGMIGLSPGEYNETDTTMLSSWARKTKQPVLIVAGSDTAEYQMTRPVFELLTNKKSQYHWAEKGRHGSSILMNDSLNWEPVWQFLHQFKSYKAEDYLGFVKETETWLAANSLTHGTHRVWPDAIDEPDQVSTSFSDGMAGKLTFYLELYQATQEMRYLETAKEIGAYLRDNLPLKQDSLKGKFWAFSPYGSVCGPGFALAELYKVTGQEEYKEAALSVVEVLNHFADNPKDTISWDLGNDVLGGLSGTGLFLLYAHEALSAPDALDMATRAGNTLLARAKKEPGGGISWKRGQNSKYILPNFSHGPAGIGYFMARLYEVTKDEKYLEAALAAVRYLDSIAKSVDGVYLVPYGFPDLGWRRAYDIGWAHGPAGVARLFIKLHQLTKEPKWLEKAEACYYGILSSMPFETPPSEFGLEPFGIDQRFGLAGVAVFAQDMYRYTDDPKYLNFATQLTTDVLSKSRSLNDRSWPIERFGFMANAGQETTFTGFFYGSTGFGSLLLEQYNVMSGKQKGIRFVDDPF